MKFAHEVFNNRSLGDPISVYELFWYPEFHAGPDHEWFKFLFFYSVELWLWLNNQGWSSCDCLTFRHLFKYLLFYTLAQPLLQWFLLVVSNLSWSLSYRHCFWSHDECCIELFSILDVSDLPDTPKYVTVLIGYFFDFRFEILILLDSFDAWWFFLDSQVIGLGKRAIFSDLNIPSS